jgi:hypothetical protein
MQLSKPPKPKATRKRLKKEILSDDFKKRKIFWKNFRTGQFSMENFPPHITRYDTGLLQKLLRCSGFALNKGVGPHCATGHSSPMFFHG